MDTDHDSAEDELVVVSTPQKKKSSREPSAPPSVLSMRPREPTQEVVEGQQRAKSSSADSGSKVAVVMVSGPARPWEYTAFDHSTTVDEILEEVDGPDKELWYKIQYEDGKTENLPADHILKLRNGRNAIDLFTNGADEVVDCENQSSMSSSIGKRIRKKTKNGGYVDVSSAQLETSEDEHVSGGVSKKRRLERGRVEQVSNRQSSRVSTRQSSRRIHDEEDEAEDTSDSGNQPLTRRSDRQSRPPPSRTRVTRSLSTKPAIVEDDEDELAAAPGTDDYDEDSDIVFEAPKKRSTRNTRSRSLPRGKGTARRRAKFSATVDGNDDESSDYSERPEPTRKSGRANKTSKSMREQGEDEVVYADDVATTTAPKVISVREIFQPIAEKDPFKAFHNNECDVCHGKGKHSNKGTSPLIHCQGCSTSIHKVCLGYRSGRDHMVTKIAHESFVMQCRRCIGLAIKKDKSAPRLDVCQSCKKPGAACAAFSKKKTSKQEEKLREENDGQDPITDVATDLINNAKNILFRCDSCQRAYHYEHLPSRTKKSKSKSKSKGFEDEDELRGLRHKEYHDYKCKECVEQPAKVQTLVAWRPTDRETYVEGDTVDMFSEDEKEYLVKWEELSYFKCTWMPGAWVWGITHATMRNSFARRDEGANLLPKWTSEEAIPEDYLRMEIIFDVTYTDDFEAESEEVDKENIGYVDKVWVKFVGLGYEEAVWQERPAPEQPEQWSSFVAAYNEYIAGKYFKQLPASDLKARIESFREELDFEKDVKYSDDRQPSALEGGELMPYQRTGCNWLLKNFHATKSVILADDMGLGKTIQIVSMIASLVKDKPQCWPFLVVTPNSTCPNWRREIKKWAPSLRVVAYYGGKAARDMAMNYELYPDGCKDMRAHIVITSYEGPTNDDSRSFFKKIKWAGMVIDEGQRLKNDENLLYGALKALKVDFRVLLTGTPLQNNLRELFNLLQFVDPSMKAAELEQKYDGNNMDSKSVKECQQLIEPYFMRRTKNEVLKFLPPMAQVIVPTTMSVLQKRLYKSILAKNPELIKSIFGQTTATLRPQEKGNLNNILMQLRKVLCHPFMFSNAIEEKSEDSEVVHRNLIDASSKLQLLDIMLPKLKERGHRVLIFSQFLDHITIIEDFLNGLGLAFTRIDGKISAMEKQKRIDAFNAPNSHLFACLLSTRAGGVGINLATADTVIIMDPDFNPHQDIQALSRAHRIGQTKKVLVFQLMTKDSAEEKITQIGRKKMALDHALIETMGADEEVAVDVESILKHGAEALFNDDDSNDIHYDSASIDKLLDRSKMEKTSTDEDNIQASAFAHARIWTNDKLSDDVGDPDTVSAVPDASVWAKILKQREADAAAEAAKNVQTLGRGKRVRKDVDYQKAELHNDNSPEKGSKRRADESDVEFASVVDSDDDDYDAPQPGDVDLRELQTGKARRTSGSPTANKQGTKTKKPVTPSKPASKQTASTKPASKPTKPTKSVGNSTVSNKQTSSVKSASRGAAPSKQKVSAKVPAKVPAKAPVKGSATSNVKVVKKAATTQQKHPNTLTSSRNSKKIDLQNSDGAGKQRASAKRPAESSVSERPNQKPKIEQEKDVANSPSLQPAKSSSPDTTQSPTMPPTNNIHPASIKQDVQINIPATKDYPSEGSNINNTHPISKIPSNTSNTLPTSTQDLLTQARPIQELPGQVMETILPSQERQSDMNHSRKESLTAFLPKTPQDSEEISPLPSNQSDLSLNQDN